MIEDEGAPPVDDDVLEDQRLAANDGRRRCSTGPPPRPGRGPQRAGRGPERPGRGGERLQLGGGLGEELRVDLGLGLLDLLERHDVLVLEHALELGELGARERRHAVVGLGGVPRRAVHGGRRALAAAVLRRGARRRT